MCCWIIISSLYIQEQSEGQRLSACIDSCTVDPPPPWTHVPSRMLVRLSHCACMVRSICTTARDIGPDIHLMTSTLWLRGRIKHRVCWDMHLMTSPSCPRGRITQDYFTDNPLSCSLERIWWIANSLWLWSGFPILGGVQCSSPIRLLAHIAMNGREICQLW